MKILASIQNSVRSMIGIPRLDRVAQLGRRSGITASASLPARPPAEVPVAALSHTMEKPSTYHDPRSGASWTLPAGHLPAASLGLEPGPGRQTLVRESFNKVVEQKVQAALLKHGVTSRAEASIPLASLPTPQVRPMAQSTPPPAVDRTGTPVKIPTPDDNDQDYTDGISQAIDALNAVIELLQEQLPDGVDASDDAQAQALLAIGKHSKALEATVNRAYILGAKFMAVQAYQALHQTTPSLTDPRSPWFAGLKAKAAPVPHVDLPTNLEAIRPSAAINEKYRRALAVLDAAIEVSAKKGSVSQDLLGRRRQVNQEWLALNRRKN